MVMCVSLILLFSLFHASPIVSCNEPTHTHMLIACKVQGADDLSVRLGEGKPKAKREGEGRESEKNSIYALRTDAM